MKNLEHNPDYIYKLHSKNCKPTWEKAYSQGDALAWSYDKSQIIRELQKAILTNGSKEEFYITKTYVKMDEHTTGDNCCATPHLQDIMYENGWGENDDDYTKSEEYLRKELLIKKAEEAGEKYFSIFGILRQLHKNLLQKKNILGTQIREQHQYEFKSIFNSILHHYIFRFWWDIKEAKFERQKSGYKKEETKLDNLYQELHKLKYYSDLAYDNKASKPHDIKIMNSLIKKLFNLENKLNLQY